MRKRFNDRDMLLLAAISLFIIPFFLPQMHERYFYPAEVISLVVLFVRPRLAWVAITMQVITIMAYMPYLTNDTQAPPIPFAALSIGVLSIIGWLCWTLFQDVTTVAVRQNKMPISYAKVDNSSAEMRQ
jgi:Gpi18-like mannosyltransferase